MPPLIVTHRPRRAAEIRALPLDRFVVLAAAIHDSDPVLRVYAAPEWQELHEDGKQWVAALVRETLALGVEHIL